MDWLYKTIVRRFLFLFNAELSHKIALTLLKVLDSLNLVQLLLKSKRLSAKPVTITIGNLVFNNRLGIAAGFDKNGDYIDALAHLNPGFIELGTVTPRSQQGNPKPRLFRLENHNAIINRMGFNNRGIDYLVKKVVAYKNSKKNNSVIIGINIGKNFDTPIESAIYDYLICFRKAYLCADYISINISSPNTANLRDLQQSSYLDNLLNQIKSEQKILNKKFNKYTPIALKIAPDLNSQEIKDICDLCLKYSIDIIIVSNTTIEHALLIDPKGKKIQGGLSGSPLFDKSNAILKTVVDCTKNNRDTHKITIIGVGGIDSRADALFKLKLGADLIQIYSGLIYQGPGLINEILPEI